MSKKKQGTDDVRPSEDTTEGKQRTMADYSFELHHDDDTITSLGLVMHYPSDAKLVLLWLEERQGEFGIIGKIRYCKKIYG